MFLFKYYGKSENTLSIVTFLLYFYIILNLLYVKYIKHIYKIFSFNCDCNPSKCFKQMLRWQNKPNVCEADDQCVANVLYELVEAICKASSSIYIAMPEFTMPELLECIMCAHSHGSIDIRIILNNADGLGNSPLMKALLKKGKNCCCFYSKGTKTSGYHLHRY